MDEELNQKISQLIDNEISPGEALSLLHKMQTQSRLLDKMFRYEAISHALKSEVYLSPPSDFTERVRQQIQHEPAYLLPQHKPFLRSYKILALAASIAVVAVIASRSMNAPVETFQAPAIAVAEPPAQESPPLSVSAQQLEQEQVNMRFNDYLRAHSDSVYINGQANFQSYARVAAYGRK